ncbi:MAG: hypothetical protein LBI96_03490, partial [Odoribacteraceae bacterium]|nr:hypothetical protein [Odoribacteraceae bacterium]
MSRAHTEVPPLQHTPMASTSSATAAIIRWLSLSKPKEPAPPIMTPEVARATSPRQRTTFSGNPVGAHLRVRP